MNLDSTVAFEMAKVYGTVLVVGFPAGASFGVDLKSWDTGEKFKGVKMIPKGVHLITYSMTAGSEGGVGGCLSSFFIHIEKRSQVIVVEWDKETESLREVREDEGSGYRDAVRRMEFDQFLAPYPFEIHEDWVKLVGATNKDDVNRIRPVGAAHIPSSTMGEDGQGPGCKLFFTAEPSRPKDLTPVEVTEWCMDGTRRLEIMFEKVGDNGVLSELSLSFILFLVGQNYSAFEQWKSLTMLTLTAERSLITHPDYHVSACNLIAAQLAHTPPEFYTVDNGFLPAAFRAFYQIQPPTPPPVLREAVNTLISKALSLMGDSILQDDDDFLPAIVEEGG